jgi:hypothetical protein
MDDMDHIPIGGFVLLIVLIWWVAVHARSWGRRLARGGRRLARALRWAGLGPGLALSAVLLHASWYALFPATMAERHEATCHPYREPWGYCPTVTLLEVAGVLLGAAGLVGLGMVAIARWRALHSGEPAVAPAHQKPTPASAAASALTIKPYVPSCIHGRVYEDCDDCEGFWDEHGNRL